MTYKRAHKGFAPLVVILAVVALVAIGSGILFAVRKSVPQTPSFPQSQSKTTSSSREASTSRPGIAASSSSSTSPTSSLSIGDSRYPTTLHVLTADELEKIRDKFLADNKGWKMIPGRGIVSASGTELLSFDNEFGFIESVTFEAPDAETTTRSGEFEYTQPIIRSQDVDRIKNFILKNAELFGVSGANDLEAGFSSTGTSLMAFYLFSQPKVRGYVVYNIRGGVGSAASGRLTAATRTDIELIQRRGAREIVANGHFWPNIYLPPSQILDAEAAKKALVGETFEYSGCAEWRYANTEAPLQYCAKPFTGKLTFTAQNLDILKLDKTIIMPIVKTKLISYADCANCVVQPKVDRIEIRLVHVFNGTYFDNTANESIELTFVIDAIDGSIISSILP
jgi:hypothetical protein